MRLKIVDILVDAFAAYLQAKRIANQSDYFKEVVDQPLVLVSQVQRSGGSLFAHLFDNHPEVYAHPGEIKIGYPDKYTWPPINIDFHSRKNFKFLLESQKYLAGGYNKARHGRRMRFYLPSIVQMTIFSNLITENPPMNERDILNAYFTSYFNAWLNFNGWLGEKKYVTGFTPRLMQLPSHREKFWEAYPDGWHIGVVRQPDGWLHSAEAKSETSRLGSNAERIGVWKDSVNSILDSKRENPERVIVLTFENLVADTPNVMRRISKKLGIRFEKNLAVPTFNSEPISSNSSFGMSNAGEIDQSVIGREKILQEKYSSQIDDETHQIYKRALEVSEKFTT
jgi:hypothetical protein